jgi:hypothetical protein
MALISDLVSAIAEVEDIPEATVNLVARYIREAGYLSTGARGRNAPRATVADAANLLIGVNGSGCVVKDAPKAVESFRALICHAPHGSRAAHSIGVEYGAIQNDQLRFLDRHGATTFGEMMESIVDRFVGGELSSFMMDEASKYLPRKFYDKAEEDLGDDLHAIAKRVAESCDGLLRLDTVSFNIEMHRPNAAAGITVDRSVGGSRELLAGVSFIIDVDDLMSGRIKRNNGDRKDRTVIGYSTLMKVAEVLRS